MPYFGDAYMADTRHLTLEEHGAYHLLLLIAWRTPDCALPNDDKRIAQMLGITPKKWAALKPTVMAFWTLTDRGWEQKRQAKERRWVDEKSRKNRAAANASWKSKSRKNNDASAANASANERANADANGYAPPPPPIDSSGSKEPSPRELWSRPPVSISRQTWSDFKQNRKSKRLGFTVSTYRNLEKDLQRVSIETGIPPPELLEHAAAHGWGGIYDPNERKKGHERDSNPTAIAVQRITGAFGACD